MKFLYSLTIINIQAGESYNCRQKLHPDASMIYAFNKNISKYNRHYEIRKFMGNDKG